MILLLNATFKAASVVPLLSACTSETRFLEFFLQNSSGSCLRGKPWLWILVTVRLREASSLMMKRSRAAASATEEQDQLVPTSFHARDFITTFCCPLISFFWKLRHLVWSHCNEPMKVIQHVKWWSLLY